MPGTVLGDRVGDKDTAVNKDQKKSVLLRAYPLLPFLKNQLY